MRAMYYLMAFVAAAMAGWCFADADYALIWRAERIRMTKRVQ